MDKKITKDYVCSKCKWYRAVRRDDRRNQYIDHPQWGRVTWEEAARRDIASHNCSTYRDALANLQLLMREAS